MKIRKATASGDDKVNLQMTPMIDIVFQLLIFFILTFKITAPEADFDIRMPKVASQGQPDINPPLPIRVLMTANDDGTMKAMKIAGTDDTKTFEDLRNHVIRFCGEATGPTSPREMGEVELVADFNLHFSYVVRAIDHVSGHIVDKKPVKLLKRIKFAPPKEPKASP